MVNREFCKIHKIHLQMAQIIIIVFHHFIDNMYKIYKWRLLILVLHLYDTSIRLPSGAKNKIRYEYLTGQNFCCCKDALEIRVWERAWLRKTEPNKLLMVRIISVKTLCIEWPLSPLIKNPRNSGNSNSTSSQYQTSTVFIVYIFLDTKQSFQEHHQLCSLAFSIFV